MKKRVFSLSLAAMSVAVFGILYPEYILLPDTYEYIIEEGLTEEMEFLQNTPENDLSDLLTAKPEQIHVSSKLLQYLAEEGKIIWKN